MLQTDEYFYYEGHRFHKRSLRVLAIFLVCLLLMTSFPSFAASVAASPLPMSNPLTQIRNFFTGEFAWTVSTISLVVSGSMLAFGSDFHGTARTFIVLAVVISAVVFANNLFTSWFSGAVIS